MTEIMIPLDKLIPHPANRRVGGFDRKKLEDLAVTIRDNGMIHAALTRVHPDKPGHWEIIAGERRWRAHKILGAAALRCVVRDLTDAQALKLCAVENLQREDLHPLDEAEQYFRLLQPVAEGGGGYDLATLAGEMGKEESYIHARQRLRTLEKSVRQAYLDGAIHLSHALLIGRLQPHDQIRALGFCTQNEWGGKLTEPPTVASLREQIRRRIIMSLAAAPWNKDDADLLQGAGACTTCPKRTGAQPGLFQELDDRKDACTDSRCFEAKLQAYLARQRDKLEKEPGAKYVEITVDGDRAAKAAKGKGRKVLLANREMAVNKDCQDTVSGLFVDGPDVGKIIRLCTNSACKQHRRAPERLEKSPADKAADKAQRNREEVGRLWRTRLFDLVLEAQRKRIGGSTGTDTLQTDDLRIIGAGVFDRLWHEHQKSIARRHDWKGSLEKGVNAFLGKASRVDLFVFIVECALIAEVSGPTYRGPRETDNLQAMARGHKIDPAKVKREAEAMVKGRDKKAGKTARRPKTGRQP